MKGKDRDKRKSRRRLANLVRNIRNKNDVTAADVETEIDDGSPSRRRIVLVQIVRVAFVEIDHQRILG